MGVKILGAKSVSPKFSDKKHQLFLHFFFLAAKKKPDGFRFLQTSHLQSDFTFQSEGKSSDVRIETLACGLKSSAVGCYSRASLMCLFGGEIGG